MQIGIKFAQKSLPGVLYRFQIWFIRCSHDGAHTRTRSHPHQTCVQTANWLYQSSLDGVSS